MSAPDIDAHLAPLGPGSVPDPAALAAGVRSYQEQVRTHLEARQVGGASGRDVNQAHSDATDRLVRRLYELAEGAFYADSGEAGERFSIAAVGGYARREMSIASDVDLIFLVEGRMGDMAQSVAERMQYALWDGGVQLGASLRSVDECITLGQEDVSACTTILGARFLGGDATLFHEFTRAVRDRLIPDVEAFIRGQREAMAERHSRYGDSLYLLQPNIKEGAGGLRDYHTATWVARASEPLVQDLGDLLHVGLLTESEMREYREALDFLWRVRNQLHLQPGRKTDQMSFELQQAIALALTGPTEGPELPVERFMREYYRHARAIQTFSEIVIEQCHARSRPRRAAPRTVEVEDGFRLADDHLEIPHAAHLRERPMRLLTAFAVAQEHQVPLSRTARRLIREHLDLIDEPFQRDPEAASTLLRILGAEHRVMRSLMAMNEVSLLGRYLPEWEHIVCRWQHVIYHTYTVDVHSIFLVEELRRLWRGKHEDGLPELTALVRECRDLPVLYLGCLLHDIGKGLGGDHSNKGAELAARCMERLGLPPDRIERAVFIVRAHLLMSHVAQRRDLGDPKVIVEFARAVGDRENLHNLYLATFADMRASSESAWTEWRYELLRELFERTAEYLESGGDDPDVALEQVEARVAVRREGAARELQALGVAEGRVSAFFEMMPRRYFISHSPAQIARHAMVVLGMPADQPVATSVKEMRGDFSELIVVTQDVHGLYGDVSGSLTASGVNILGSHVYTTRTGLALEIYRVSTPDGEEDQRGRVWAKFRDTLQKVISRDLAVADALKGMRRPTGQTRLPSNKPPSVAISNEDSDFYTVVDVTTDDRLGLLYDLTRTMALHECAIFVSKATTVLDQVADTFYIKGPDGRKVTDPEALRNLRADLLEVVERDPDA